MEKTEGIQREHFICISLACFSVITNVQDTVSITPMDDAKTFVNGNLISESTVLHHVSRPETDLITHLKFSITLWYGATFFVLICTLLLSKLTG